MGEIKRKEDHPLYSTWKSMKSRCYNPNRRDYRYYGGRGIGVCDSWIKSFERFVEDMGERPEGHTLDREGNDKGYSPSNCRWVGRKEQLQNRRYCKQNRLGEKHISFHKGSYIVRVSCSGETIHLGCFSRLEDAIEKRDSYLREVT